ncbi:SDR family oxidoreductase [Kitasatospora sp. NPDC001683]
MAHVLGDPAEADAWLDEALAGVDTVLHLAGGPKGDDEATRRLVAAARRAGVRHLVYVAGIGADKVPLGYFQAKHAAEEAVAGSGPPYTILRAAQFHDLAFAVVEKMAKPPLLPAPGGVRWQPVDVREVGGRLVELAFDEPAGLVPDLAGPTVYGMDELARAYLTARGRSRKLPPVREPGRVGRAYRAGRTSPRPAPSTGGAPGRSSWRSGRRPELSLRGRRVSAMSFLDLVRATPVAVDYLLWPGDFNLDAYSHVEEVVLASGEGLEEVAKCGAGGTFFLCGEGGDERPVLYADSEGGAAVMAVGLEEMVRLLLAVPWWRDCVRLTEEESAEAAEQYLEDEPDLFADRDAAAAALGLEVPTVAEALARLREVAFGLGPSYVLLNAEEGNPYEPLFRP